MRLENFTQILRFGSLLTFSALLLLASAPVRTALCAEFDIPLTELKESPKKKAAKAADKKQAKEKKTAGQKNVARKAQTKKAIAANVADNSQEPVKSVKSGNQAAIPTVSVEQAANIITHLPFSYVISRKRTRISAVITSSDTPQAVRCQFRSSVSASGGQTTMTRTGDSQFTYTATIPALDGSAQSLQYRIIVVEQDGRVVRSQEYTIPVRDTSVLPGWQEEPGLTPVLLRVGSPGNRPEGFTDTFTEEQ